MILRIKGPRGAKEGFWGPGDLEELRKDFGELGT